ncbi:hypothetical protein RJ639_037561 [Escallonia herrerae]|uniref:MLO-like protein n=1 Tax=Escallonia herrerae TaxID=1293975 RepID=A0AA88WIG1_9ASTE|nr:hypothetical protein RJ639_037561 [Escallonia herrerae]
MPTICGVPVTLLLDLPVLQSLHFLKKVFKTSSEKCGERRYNGGVDKGGEVFVRDANMVGCNSHYGHGLRVSLGSTVHIPWLKKTRRKALFASLEKIKEGHCLSRADALPVMPEKLLCCDLVISHEIDIYGTELMLLGLISLLLGQWARVISQICVDSSLFSTKFFICSEEDYGMVDAFSITKLFSLNETDIPPKGISNPSSHQCGEGREPFVSYQGLEQLHRFLFVLGMTHVLYSCIAVGLAMSKVHFLFTAGENGKTKQAYCLMGIYKVHNMSGAKYLWTELKQRSVLAGQDPKGLKSYHCPYHATQQPMAVVTLALATKSALFFCSLYVNSEPFQMAHVSATKIINCHFLIIFTITSFGAWKMNFMEWWALGMLSNFRRWTVNILLLERLDKRMNVYCLDAFIKVSCAVFKTQICLNERKLQLNHASILQLATLGLCHNMHLHKHSCSRVKFALFAGLNIYFWLSFIPAILVMLVGTKLQHVVSVLALEIVEPRGPSTATQVKPRDDLFWFGKPDILLRLIQFISFQNAFEMATFIWSLVRGDPLGIQAAIMFHEEPCNDHHSVNLWMGSRCKKALIAESVRDSLHSWCKRVKEKSRRDALHSITTRSTCSLGSTIDEGDEVITIASGTLSPCSSNGSLNRLDENMVSTDHLENATNETFHQSQHEVSFRISECSANPISNGPSQPMMTGAEDNAVERDGEKVETLMDLFRKT